MPLKFHGLQIAVYVSVPDPPPLWLGGVVLTKPRVETDIQLSPCV